MADLLTSGQIGTISAEHQRIIREQTIQKWSALGFLNGYEGEASQLINEVTEQVSGSLYPFGTTLYPVLTIDGLDVYVDPSVDLSPKNNLKKHSL